jgi:hypothetical protein
MTTVRVMYWKDIPCSIRAEAGRRNRVTRKLPDIYMAIVDAVAMKDGTVGSEEYQAAFRWTDPEEREGTPEEVAATVAAEVQDRYPREWLLERARQAGIPPDSIGNAGA